MSDEAPGRGVREPIDTIVGLGQRIPAPGATDGTTAVPPVTPTRRLVANS